MAPVRIARRTVSGLILNERLPVGRFVSWPSNSWTVFTSSPLSQLHLYRRRWCMRRDGQQEIRRIKRQINTKKRMATERISGENSSLDCDVGQD